MIHSWHSWQIKVCNIWNLISPGYLLLSKFPFLTTTTVTIFSGLLVLVLGEWGHCFKPQRRRYLHIFFPLNLYFSELLLKHFLCVYGFSIRASYLPWQPFIYLLSLTTLCKRVCSSRYIISALFYINWWLIGFFPEG